MTRLQDFRLPDLGEGLTEGEILKWLVQPGEQVRLNQPLVEVETAKAAVEVPSPYAGVVVRIHHEAGQVVDVGTPIVTVDTDPTAGPLEPPATEPPAGPPTEQPATETDAVRRTEATGPPSEVAADAVPASTAPLVDASKGVLIGQSAANGRTATLVGYGPRSGPPTRRRRAPAARSEPERTAPAHHAPARISAAAVGQAAAVTVGRSDGGVSVLAKPPVRKLAKELGVDLAGLHGTGPRGSITRADVEAAAATARVAAPAPAAAFDPTTRERRVPVRGVRRAMAQAMVASASTAPHVTVFTTVDVTPTMELRDRVAALPEFAEVKVTPLLFVAKALLLAVRRHPEVNSTWDEAAQEIVVKDYVNLGIAAATPRGLLVPNVKDADRLDLHGLAQALQDLATTAREGRTAPEDMQHGTITITNVGVFGVDTGTPILNPGEAAILCLGAVRPTPWVVDGGLAVRQVTQLALSFDHRIVDGQLGSQFLADVARVLADPATALLWG